MANIQPYNYQKRTNIEEHNDLVSKINEIVDVINQTNIETIVPKITKLEADVSTINDTDNVQNTDISNLKEKDIQIDNRLDLNESNIDGITKSLVSDLVLMNGTTTGNMKARIGREDAPSIDSNDYNIQKPVSVELVQGSASAMVKVKITLSDGTVLISDDFMFTTEAIGTDVYISSFTFKNGNVAGTISADIGLSNGSTLEANNFMVPTDPSIVSSIDDIRSALNTKADLSNPSQDIKAQRFTGTYGSFNAIYGQNIRLVKSGSNVIILRQTGNNKNPVEVLETTSGKDVFIGNLAFLDTSGNPVNFTTGGGSTPVSEWETLDLVNMPTDFVMGDEVEIDFYRYDCYYSETGPTSWTDDPRPYSDSNDQLPNIATCKFTLDTNNYPLSFPISTNYIDNTMFIAYADHYWGLPSRWNNKTYGEIKVVKFNAGGCGVNTISISASFPLNQIVKAIRRKKRN